ncbi:hypothetical protein D1816_08895 [Aquimarina sp. AD10]|uniref:lipocalin family protein n=1 Tax=Aquimarina sp. AD10 TaxID=1714849 RepID=UPI000E4B7593|nr:lipocalin family protein [Aquimarina sp. AD10]AXT60462.1 hypothetical protein D1816_08895 [Aquimarina sp. AD10]RKM96947.1 hypothetical protein D7033_14620 [Aquimarina sp. AD10]
MKSKITLKSIRLSYVMILIILLHIFGCSKPNPDTFADKMNGYWEIEKVTLSDGTKKEYNFNQSIDFFEIKDSIGIRKKVQPKLDGSFIISKDVETFTLKIEGEQLKIYYKTTLTNWVEIIELVEENNMVIKNEAGNVYFYKRYQKIQL